jgi:hypothetical protein
MLRKENFHDERCGIGAGLCGGQRRSHGTIYFKRRAFSDVLLFGKYIGYWDYIMERRTGLARCFDARRYRTLASAKVISADRQSRTDRTPTIVQIGEEL